jgi:hypothetical protein
VKSQLGQWWNGMMVLPRFRLIDPFTRIFAEDDSASQQRPEARPARRRRRSSRRL